MVVTAAAPKEPDSSPTANVLAIRPPSARRDRRARPRRPGGSCRPGARDPEHVDGNLAVAQEILNGLQLHGILIDERQRGVRTREPMRSNLAVLRGGIGGIHERHVAVGAFLRLRRIVERPRALSRHARRLPVVVIVEAPEPSIAVHRLVEMHLVAGRAELRGLLAVERLQERFAMRFGREVQKGVVRPPQHGVLAGGEVVQRRVLDLEIALPHRAVHARDRMAGGAGQTRLRLRRIDLLLDRTVEATVEEHRMIVAARTPFRGLRADHVLHVLDRLPIPLVVERREVVRRRVPLLVDVLCGNDRSSRSS